jgi:hypothetical protein
MARAMNRSRVLLLIAGLLAGTAAFVVVPTSTGVASVSATINALTTRLPNPALADMVAGVEYTGTGKLAAELLRSDGEGCLRERYGVFSDGSCRGQTVRSTISFDVAPDKSKITNLSTNPLSPPEVAGCPADVPGLITLTRGSPGTTASASVRSDEAAGSVKRHRFLTFFAHGFSFRVFLAAVKVHRRTVVKTAITATFPPSGAAHVAIRFLARSTVHGTTFICSAKELFPVRPSS